MNGVCELTLVCTNVDFRIGELYTDYRGGCPFLGANTRVFRGNETYQPACSQKIPKSDNGNKETAVESLGEGLQEFFALF